jgi:hypothetical protein
MKDGSAETAEYVDRLLQLVKNNVAIDLKRYPATVWFVCDEGFVKNTLANAKVIVVEGLMHVARQM